MESFNLDTLVELQDQYSNVYPLSPTGARGWVRARRQLPKTDPEVFIEWDKAHWRYHGEKDGWTFEHHFRPVVDDLAPPEEIPGAVGSEQILDEARARLDAQRCVECGDIHDGQDEFIDMLASAQTSMLASDGFFIVCVQPREVDGFMVYEPEIFQNSLTHVAKSVLETQLVHIAAQLFERFLVARVNDVEGNT